MTEPITRSSRQQTGRKRRQVIVVTAVVAVLLAVVGVAVLVSGGGDEKVAKAAPPTTTTIPPTTTTTNPPAATVATTKGSNIAVFDAPNGTNVVTSLSAKTEYLQPRTLLVTEQQGDWLKALLPMRPNESQGWIRLGDVALSQNPYKITVSLTDHKVTLYKDGKEIVSSGAVVGADRTPTPVGTYYITDPVDLQSRPGGAYGAFALGLSAYSEVLFEFNGGPGQIAIHGTNNPELIGQNVSNGCIRVPNDVILQIAEQAPLGTPVIITA
jgi:lipoprotein-anchoring transpeptidase ErfK/SrfK